MVNHIINISRIPCDDDSSHGISWRTGEWGMKELEEGKVECEHMPREAVESKKQNHYIQFNIVA